MSGPAAARLPDGRLHFQHGPIDLILDAWGPEAERVAAFRQGWAFFRTVLDDLVAVLPRLRTPVTAPGPGAFAPGSVAARMLRATAPHAPAFVTPMAAVAGAVADAVLAEVVEGRRLIRAYVNNGGDAAFWLSPGTALTAAGGPGLRDRVEVRAESQVRGIATSGWRGRSHSLGIADAVTVLARSAAEADAAATLIANAVDLPGHPAIRRRPARALSAESDLGDRPVTVGVGTLTPGETGRALDAGQRVAERMLRNGLIAGAALWLQDRSVVVGSPGILPAPDPDPAGRDARVRAGPR